MAKYKYHAPFIAICTAMLALGTVLIFSWYQYQLNPDAASYYTIAEKYAHGDIKHAINGYWGPLISWLLVPAVWMGANLIIAAKIILLITSTLILVVLYRFLLKHGVSRAITTIICLGLAGMMTDWSVAAPVTPDLLMTFLVLLFSVTFIDFLAKPTRKLAIYLGIIGALMYFAKGFGFYLFLAVTGGIAIWQWRWVDRNFMTVFKRYLPTVIVFAALVLPFIGAISLKYDKLTINNAGAYDHHIYGPIGQAIGPMTYLGPLTPPNDTAMSVWEDPTLLTNLVPSWNPLDSKHNLWFFVSSTVGRNLNVAVHGLYGYGPFAVLAIFGLLLGVLQRKKYITELRFFTGISILMIGAYSLVLIDTRYLWATVVLAAAGTALLVSDWQRRKAVSTVQIWVVGLLACAVSLLFTGQSTVAFRDLDEHWYLASMSIQDTVPKNSKIISDDFSGSFFACHHLKLRCYSILNPPIENTEPYYKTLKQQGITYFVDYHTRETNKDLYRFVDQHFTKIVTKQQAGHVITVYRIR